MRPNAERQEKVDVNVLVPGRSLLNDRLQFIHKQGRFMFWPKNEGPFAELGSVIGVT